MPVILSAAKDPGMSSLPCLVILSAAKEPGMRGVEILRLRSG